MSKRTPPSPRPATARKMAAPPGGLPADPLAGMSNDEVLALAMQVFGDAPPGAGGGPRPEVLGRAVRQAAGKRSARPPHVAPRADPAGGAAAGAPPPAAAAAPLAAASDNAAASGTVPAPSPAPAQVPAVIPPAFVDMLEGRPQRHDGWTAAKVAAFIDALREDGSIARAARAVGMTRGACYALRNGPGGEPFAAAWDEAIAVRHDVLTDLAIDRVRDGVDVVRFWRGEAVFMDKVYSDRLLIHLLNQTDPHRQRLGGAASADRGGSSVPAGLLPAASTPAVAAPTPTVAGPANALPGPAIGPDMACVGV